MSGPLLCLTLFPGCTLPWPLTIYLHVDPASVSYKDLLPQHTSRCPVYAGKHPGYVNAGNAVVNAHRAPGTPNHAVEFKSKASKLLPAKSELVQGSGEDHQVQVCLSSGHCFYRTRAQILHMFLYVDSWLFLCDSNVTRYSEVPLAISGE